MLLTPINPEVISPFPVRRGAHFLSEWQRRSEVTEGGQQSVSHQHPSALSLSLDSLYSLFLLHSFILLYINSSSCLSDFLHFFLLPVSATHSFPSTFHFLLLLLSRWHALPSVPPRLTHTRTDLTISPIQPPKSNYHGQNRVIKSNGLLYEVHTQKSFSTLIHNILFVTHLLLAMINWFYSFGPQYTNMIEK